MAHVQYDKTVLQKHRPLSDAKLAYLRSRRWGAPDSEIPPNEAEGRAALQSARLQMHNAAVAQAEARLAIVQGMPWPDLESEIPQSEEEQRTNDTAGSHPPGPAAQQPPETATQDNGSQASARRASDNKRKSRPGGNDAVNTTTFAGNGQAIGDSERRVCSRCKKDVDYTVLVIHECGHIICDECVADEFRTACADESSYPPECCGMALIPLSDSVFRRLPETLAERFRYRQEEMNMEPEIREYCHYYPCRRYIPEQNVKRWRAKCVECRRLSCTVCKRLDHSNKVLTVNFGPQGLHDLAGAAGGSEWQRCPWCKAAVERSSTYCLFVGEWQRSFDAVSISNDLHSMPKLLLQFLLQVCTHVEMLWLPNDIWAKGGLSILAGTDCSL